MTSQSPRIYLYKIIFEEVPYYYYGVHKEKKYNEEYWGSPKTNKWCWELYTPKKQILEIFEFSDEGWLEAQEVETRLIKPFYNTDKWCLNESCGGLISYSTSSKGGKISGQKHKENRTGVCGRSEEKMSEDGKKATERARELGVGLYGLTKEQRIDYGAKGGSKTYEEGNGCFSLTPEERSEVTRKVNNQRWECCETGFITNAGALTNYQKAKGIDTSKRKRIV